MSRTSVLPISTNRPARPRPTRRREASTNSPDNASSTTSTPCPLVAVVNCCSNSVVREEAMWSSGMPAARRTCHLPVEAVP